MTPALAAPNPSDSFERELAAMFCVGVVSLQLVKSFAMRRTKTNMNPPVTIPHITGTDT